MTDLLEALPPPSAFPSGARFVISLIYGTNRRCCWCGTSESLDIDHIIPRSRGGNSYPNNLRILCRACNTRKGDWLDEELAWLNLLRAILPVKFTMTVEGLVEPLPRSKVVKGDQFLDQEPRHYDCQGDHPRRLTVMRLWGRGEHKTAVCRVSTTGRVVEMKVGVLQDCRRFYREN